MRKIDYRIDDFMFYCETKDLTKKTMSSYEATLKLFARYLLDVHSIEDAEEVKEITIREYIKHIKERGNYTMDSYKRTKQFNNPENRTDYDKKVSKTTINNYIRNIKVFFNYLYDQDIISKNLM